VTEPPDEHGARPPAGSAGRMVKLGRRHRAVVVETARQQAPTVRQQRRVSCWTSAGRRRCKHLMAFGANVSGTWPATSRIASAFARCSCVLMDSWHGRAIRLPFPRKSGEPRRDGGELHRSGVDAIVARRPMDAAIRIGGSIKRYGGVTAVDGLDLVVGRGECFGLLGPNGAGKTCTIERALPLDLTRSGARRSLSAVAAGTRVGV
jgi:ABC-type glutathione transport system ATPase component